MRKFVQFAMVAALASASCIAADAPESQYDKSKARKLTPEEVKNFGPQAGKYNYDARMIRARRSQLSGLGSTRRTTAGAT
jgi:hypothetical protein